MLHIHHQNSFPHLTDFVQDSQTPMLDWMDKGVIAFKIDSSSIVIHCASHAGGIHFANVFMTLYTGYAHDYAHSL